MPVVTVHNAKPNTSRLIKKAAGEEVFISRCDQPVARRVPIGWRNREVRTGAG
jgi:antitoxin (DNA-binding transcriptional repressor) of toxin-antitoxin stability system